LKLRRSYSIVCLRYNGVKSTQYEINGLRLKG